MAVLGRTPGEREARRAATEAQILRATEDLLREGTPYANLSVEQIATRAEISRTGFYAYFADKRELLVKLVETAAAPLAAEADEMVAADRDGPEEIAPMVDAAVRFANEGREAFRAVCEAATYDSVVADFWHGQVLDRFADAVEQRIRTHQAAGRALPIHPRATARALILMVVDALYQHVTRDDGLSEREVRDTLVTVCVRAVFGPSGDRADR